MHGTTNEQKMIIKRIFNGEDKLPADRKPWLVSADLPCNPKWFI